MATPITVSGFNNIDFNVILNAVMAQESAPLTTMQSRQTQLKSQSSAFGSLATKLDALQSAAETLTGRTALNGRTATTGDAAAVSVDATSSAAVGTYDVIVQELARAQVTASTSTAPDTDTTVVATGGTITIGGVDVTLAGDTTLQGLADAINGTAGIDVAATIISPASGQYQLVLTSLSTGQAGAFTIANDLTGASVAFTDTDADGVSGDSAADNAVQGTDAVALVNNLTVRSSTNTIDGAIPGATLTLRKKDPATTVTVAIESDPSTARAKAQAFVDAYNSFMTFVEQQNATTGALGRDAMFRTLHNELRARLSSIYAVGGSTTSLPSVGIGFDTSGHLTLDPTTFDAAIAAAPGDVEKLCSGDGVDPGLFGSLSDLVGEYTATGGLIASTQDRLDAQVKALDQQMSAFSDRLAIRKAALQKEYIAADQAISSLNGQAGSLSSLGSEYRLF